jgi:hypothetical protein
MDPVETSLLYLSSRQRVDPGADNNAEFEVVTPNSVHTQSIVEVCPVQVSFPNLFDNVVKDATFTVTYSGTPTQYTLTQNDPIYSYSATYTPNTTLNTSGSASLGVTDLTQTAKQWTDQINLSVNAPNGLFYFTVELGVLKLTLRNQEVGSSTIYDNVVVNFGSNLSFLNSQYTLSSPTNTFQTQTFTILTLAPEYPVTVSKGHYTALELIGLLTAQADPGGTGAWSVVDDNLTLDPGAGSNWTTVTITQTGTDVLQIIDQYDFYGTHSLSGGAFSFGRLNLHPLSNVFVGVSNLAASTFTHGGTGHLYDVLCCIPVGRYGYGNLVYWEPSDQGLARLRLPRATIHDRVKITLLDDNLNPLYLDRHYHVDVVMKIYNSNHGRSTGRI